MPILAKIASGAPERLRKRAERRGVQVAQEINGDIMKILGVRGTRRSPSRPGEAPRSQTGHLKVTTRARFDAATLSFVITTPQYGIYLNQGTRRMAARPFKDRIVAAAKLRMKKLTSLF